MQGACAHARASAPSSAVIAVLDLDGAGLADELTGTDVNVIDWASVTSHEGLDVDHGRNPQALAASLFVALALAATLPFLLQSAVLNWLGFGGWPILVLSWRSSYTLLSVPTASLAAGCAAVTCRSTRSPPVSLPRATTARPDTTKAVIPNGFTVWRPSELGSGARWPRPSSLLA